MSRKPRGESPTWRQRLRALLAPIPGAVPFVRLVAETVTVIVRYRATGLAAEAAYFMLLSLPPLILGLVAGAGFASDRLGPETLDQVTGTVEEWSLRIFTPDMVEEVIVPTFQDTLTAGRADILSLGFVVAIWSGSRALHTLINTISIMYGQRGDRGPIMARVLSFTTYLASIIAFGLVLPLLLVGPGYLRRWLPDELEPLIGLYWPLVGILGILSLTGLYHVATPVRSPYLRDLPGALLAVALWIVGSVLLRWWAESAAGGVSVFGPLTAPIILLVYLYFLAVSVLIGAAFNAALRRLWPPPEYRGPRARVNEWWEDRRARTEP